MMSLQEALSIFINPKEHKEDKIVMASGTIAAEMQTRPSLGHLLNLIPREYEVDETASLNDLVDDLGFLKANIKTLQNAEELIKKLLHISGEKEIEGKIFACTISEPYVATSISLSKIEKEDPNLFKALTKYVKFSTVKGKITVRAR